MIFPFADYAVKQMLDLPTASILEEDILLLFILQRQVLTTELHLTSLKGKTTLRLTCMVTSL